MVSEGDVPSCEPYAHVRVMMVTPARLVSCDAKILKAILSYGFGKPFLNFINLQGNQKLKTVNYAVVGPRYTIA